MSIIAGKPLVTPYNPNKMKPSGEEIKQAVDSYLAENPVEGTPGKDGDSTLICSTTTEITNHIKGYTARYFSFLWGGDDEVVFTLSNGDEYPLYKGQLYRCTIVSSKVSKIEDLGNLNGKNGYTPYIGDNGNWHINGVDQGIPAEGTVINKTEINDEGHLIIHYTDNSTSDAGRVVVSDKYELIREINVSDEYNVNKDKSFFDIEVNHNGKSFELKAITIFCTLPAMTKTAIDVLVKTKNTIDAYVSAYRRSSVSNTEKQYYYRVRLQNEGYWTGDSLVYDNPDTVQSVFGIFARNSVRGNATGIRIATGDSSIVFPEGTIIEIWGVKA